MLDFEASQSRIQNSCQVPRLHILSTVSGTSKQDRILQHVAERDAHSRYLLPAFTWGSLTGGTGNLAPVWGFQFDLRFQHSLCKVISSLEALLRKLDSALPWGLGRMP